MPASRAATLEGVACVRSWRPSLLTTIEGFQSKCGGDMREMRLMLKASVIQRYITNNLAVKTMP